MYVHDGPLTYWVVAIYVAGTFAKIELYLVSFSCIGSNNMATCTACDLDFFIGCASVLQLFAMIMYLGSKQ